LKRESKVLEIVGGEALEAGRLFLVGCSMCFMRSLGMRRVLLKVPSYIDATFQ
jgi:hypothetical protein